MYLCADVLRQVDELMTKKIWALELLSLVGERVTLPLVSETGGDLLLPYLTIQVVVGTHTVGWTPK